MSHSPIRIESDRLCERRTGCRCREERKPVMAAATRSAKSSTRTEQRDRAALPTAEAAHYIGVAYGTLKKWRVTGDGPAYARLGTKAGARIVYLIEDLDAWLRANRVA